jgi:hypothetical protein
VQADRRENRALPAPRDEHQRPAKLGRNQVSARRTGETKSWFYRSHSLMRDPVSANRVIWNVFDRKKVDPDVFTFDDHFEIICLLLNEVGGGGCTVFRKT